MSRILLRCKWPIELIVVLLGPLLIGVPPVPHLRPCRALQKSPLFVRWRHSGILRACGSMVKFYTVYCASSYHENILCNFGTNLHFCVIFNCCEARTVNCTRAIEHRNEIAKCFLTVRILGNIFRLCIPCIDIILRYHSLFPSKHDDVGPTSIRRPQRSGNWRRPVCSSARQRADAARRRADVVVFTGPSKKLHLPLAGPGPPPKNCSMGPPVHTPNTFGLHCAESVPQRHLRYAHMKPSVSTYLYSILI